MLRNGQTRFQLGRLRVWGVEGRALRFTPSNEGTVDSVKGDKLTIRFKNIGLKVVLESYVKAG